MKYIDIGVNLFDKQFRNKENDIVKSSYDNQIGIIITGSSVKSSIKASNYVSGKQNVYSTAGVHPHSAKTCDANTISILRNLCKKCKNIVAIGECGLDYDRMFSPAEIQREWFEKQILLAEELNMPLFLHERSAERDFIKIMKKHPDICKKSVVHCYTGTKATVQEYLDLGCYVGITGWICDERRNTELLEAMDVIPLDRLMIETDAPYLTPRVAGLHSPNLPNNIVYVLERIAKIKNIDQEDLRKIVLENTKNFFGI